MKTYVIISTDPVDRAFTNFWTGYAWSREYPEARHYTKDHARRTFTALAKIAAECRRDAVIAENYGLDDEAFIVPGAL